MLSSIKVVYDMIEVELHIDVKRYWSKTYTSSNIILCNSGEGRVEEIHDIAYEDNKYLQLLT